MFNFAIKFENNKLKYSLKDKERVKIMDNFEELNFSYLALLSNAHHDGTTQQIDDLMGNYETENQRLIQKATALHQCRVKEDEAWKKSQVDPVVKQLQAADKRQDNYMSCFHSIVNGYASLPEDEAQKAQAQSAKQVFKDFVFSINDSYGAEADKILQMGQNLLPLQEFLTQIGAWQWYVKAAQSAQMVNHWLAERAKTKGETVKGELKAARRATDLAVADLYKTINAMMDLMPSDALTALYTQLKGFERYAKQYYLSKGKDEDELEPTPVDPETTAAE